MSLYQNRRKNAENRQRRTITREPGFRSEAPLRICPSFIHSVQHSGGVTVPRKSLAFHEKSHFLSTRFFPAYFSFGSSSLLFVCLPYLTSTLPPWTVRPCLQGRTIAGLERKDVIDRLETWELGVTKKTLDTIIFIWKTPCPQPQDVDGSVATSCDNQRGFRNR